MCACLWKCVMCTLHNRKSKIINKLQWFVTAYTYAHYIGKCFKVHVTMIGCLSQPHTHTIHSAIHESPIHSLDAHFTSRNVENRKNRRTCFVQWIMNEGRNSSCRNFRAEFVVPELFEFMYFGLKKKKCVYMFAS